MSCLSNNEYYQKEGYQYIEALNPNELLLIKELILKVVNTHGMPFNVKFNSWNQFIYRYQNENEKLHNSLSEKKTRTFKNEDLEKIMSLSIFRNLNKLIGDYEISDEENYGYEEIYWRIVRPSEAKDIGNLHADGWFWDLNPEWSKSQELKKRTKVWVAVQTENKCNGLLILPRSHISDCYKYNIINTNGKLKPKIKDDVPLDSLQLATTKPGQGLIFHDRLLHGGALNRGQFIRVSFEFTCLHK